MSFPQHIPRPPHNNGSSWLLHIWLNANRWIESKFGIQLNWEKWKTWSDFCDLDFIWRSKLALLTVKFQQNNNNKKTRTFVWIWPYSSMDRLWDKRKKWSSFDDLDLNFKVTLILFYPSDNKWVVVNGINLTGVRFCRVSPRASFLVPFVLSVHRWYLIRYCVWNKTFCWWLCLLSWNQGWRRHNEASEGYWSIGLLGKDMGYGISTCQIQYDAADKKTDQDPCFIYLRGNWPWKRWKHQIPWSNNHKWFEMEYTCKQCLH